MSIWSNCSKDGRLCYVCTNEPGVYICNWFYEGVWLGSTKCDNDFNSILKLYEEGTFKPDVRVGFKNFKILTPL